MQPPDSSAPTVLVTGATGFVGSHVVRAARAAGFRVVALVRARTERPERAVFDGEARAGDLRDEATLDAAVRGVDVVLHLAGLTRARNEAEFHDANAEGTARLVRAVRRAAPGLRRFVLISSLAAAGPSPDGRPLREDEAPRPVSAYGRSKLAGEEALRREAGPVPWTIVRPPIVYGPEDADVLALIRLARRRFVPVVGDGRGRYSVVYAEDLARGILELAAAPTTAGRAYFVADPETYDHRALFAAFGAAVGGRPRLVRLPRVLATAAAAAGSALKPFLRRPPLLTLDKLPEVLAPHWTCSAEAAARDAGFRTRTSLADGVAATVAWARARGKL